MFDQSNYRMNDEEVYCANHVPIAGPHDLPPSRSEGSPVENGTGKTSNGHRRDAGLADMKIAHAIKATQVAKPYPKIVHKGARYAVDYDAQTRLELLHRRAEDQLYDSFQNQRTKENEQFESETRVIERKIAIYRWITIKNLNTMIFDDSIEHDTPMGLLRGIKYGTESYHVLFKRLCSYAGLHCVVIKGYSKSAGYQPGYSFDDNRFRAIYRWITIKNLNTMIFDDSIEHDTPMGLLRGIKYGTESYHVLFKRLCSYAGLHCVVIKGYSKSAGYQPGYSFDDNRFRNAKDSDNENRSDGNLRYEYDDHYFMTDPEEFIYEFLPHDPNWQLLPRPITLKQFERIPFVRSLFFKYGLSFVDNRLESTLYTDKTGATSVAIRLPEKSGDSLIFHYNLKFFDSDENTVNGLSLKRFVMQSVSNGVVCDSLQVIMVPLPECASGEWGPAKATRLFGLRPISHIDAIINAGRSVEIRFKMTKRLCEVVSALHRNRTDDRVLQNCCRTILKGDQISIFIDFPEEGQYGLDIYTRQDDQLVNGRQLLTHCCKYLIHSRNC
ncbi:hypothetical protein NECAME_13296 [Necator americanus]|uniref:KY-like immunoglobulin-like domain-containing protein n=1 Tax=Necator americanus TaxID=51031 RepID=W2SZ74_NECAM|nr:hypothetical protein NECAME_13296 [Necator americanus]ETN73992.1 hypothetical protein NECAME_13296 [Necator americanus]